MSVVMSGLQIPVSGGVTGQTLGIRTEYGLSKLFSIVGDVQGNKSGNSFSQGQVSLAARYMPFTFNRFQPYVSAGLGAGTSNGRSQGHGHCHHQFQQPVTTTAITQANGETLTPVPTTPTQRHLQGFALIQIGVNFKVNSHFFAHAETTFQTQLSRHPEPGVFAIRAGMSYQFGNN